MNRRFLRLWPLLPAGLLALQCGVDPGEPAAMYQQAADGIDLCEGCKLQGPVRLLVQPIGSKNPVAEHFDVEVVRVDQEFSGTPTLTVDGEHAGTLALPPGAYRWRARPQQGRDRNWVAFADGKIAFMVEEKLPAQLPRAPESRQLMVKKEAPLAPPSVPVVVVGSAPREAQTAHRDRGIPAPDDFVKAGILTLPNCPSPLLTGQWEETRRCWDAWERKLPRAQRRWFNKRCGGEQAEFDETCGNYNTPLVAVFDGRPVAFTEPGDFVLEPGVIVRSAWPSPRTPWLARDLDGNGLIDSARELFGSNTVLPSGRTAGNGFEALQVLDENGDGVLDARDPAFATLLLWSDEDGDRRCTPDELRPAEGSIISIDLKWSERPRCDERGNCERERSAMRFRDSSGDVVDGEVVDVWLRHEP